MLYASDSLQGHVGLNQRDVIGHSIHDIVQSEEDSEIIRDNLQPRGEGRGSKGGGGGEGGGTEGQRKWELRTLGLFII